MIITQVNWVRSHSNKMCPILRKHVLSWYRPTNHMPCFTQSLFIKSRQRWSKIPVIVQTTESFDNMSLNSLAQVSGCCIKRALPLINAFSTEVNENSLRILLETKNIKRIWYDTRVSAVLDVASPTVKAVPLWNDNYTGKGIVVAVLDTGVYNHPDLSGRIVGFIDLINNKSETYDDNGHGTHVAGCIAASGSLADMKYRGTAPDAGILGIKVLNKSGTGSLSTIIEGVQWCISNQESKNIRIINMSLGSAANLSYLDDPVCQAVEKAWHSGLIVCVAAGNEGPDSRSIGSPGIDPVIITVGATDDSNTVHTGDDWVAEFSSRGPTRDNLIKPDFLAPGTNIISLRSPSSHIDKTNKESRVNNWYTSLSGTSMAAPICAGVTAQLLQVNNSLTPDQVKKILRDSSSMFPDLDPNIQGSGLINSDKAAELASLII